MLCYVYRVRSPEVHERDVLAFGHSQSGRCSIGNKISGKNGKISGKNGKISGKNGKISGKNGKISGNETDNDSGNISGKNGKPIAHARNPQPPIFLHSPKHQPAQNENPGKNGKISGNTIGNTEVANTRVPSPSTLMGQSEAQVLSRRCVDAASGTTYTQRYTLCGLACPLYSRLQEGCEMSGKVKMRCARCGKQFKSASAKQTLCADCEIKERQARAATKAQGPKPAVPAAAAHPQQPRIVGPGAGILVPGMAPTAIPAEQEHNALTSASAHAAHATHQRPASGTTEQATRPPHEKHEKHEHHDKHDKHGGAGAQPARQPKPAPQSKQRKPPEPTFVITDEIRAKIEQRYLELAQPVEFNGIRTRISEELGAPKSAVRHVVKDVRTRLQMPSWWELQAFSGSDEDLARIRGAYEPLLPLPPVGIHKQLASTLGLEPVVVYHGIRRIRAEMHLPQFNPPEAHATPEDSRDELSASHDASAISPTPSSQSTTPATAD